MKKGMVMGPLLALIVGFGLAALAQVAAAGCGTGIGFQVLGSGGPTPYGKRASSGYLVWIDGKSRILLDAGGGTYARFKTAGGQMEDLKLISLSHLHADHSAELPAYIKGAYFTTRKKALPISGPSGAALFPGIEEFMQRLFNANRGAFAYLSGTLDGTGGQAKTPVHEVSIKHNSKRQVLSEKNLVVYAQGVPHGPVPALAYRVEMPGYTIVYGGDQNGDDEAFIEFAHDADLLVMHLAIPEDATGTAVDLHAKPSEIANIARKSGAKHILLSHIMPRSERALERWKTMIAKTVNAPVSVAEDLMCISGDQA